MVRDIDIKSDEQINRINRLACQAPYEVWLSTDTVMLDARSLLGLYALVGKRAKVVTARLGPLIFVLKFFHDTSKNFLSSFRGGPSKMVDVAWNSFPGRKI